MKKQPKISEILHLAADKYLSSDGRERHKKCAYSCNAVLHACDDLTETYWQSSALDCVVKEGLQAMGCVTISTRQFIEFPKGPARQAARYAWLKFAAMIAEEQGV